jgi:cell division protein FtsB
VRRTVWAGVVSVLVVGFLFLAVFPTRTYLAQRRNLAAAQHRVEILNRENARLAARAKQLHSDAEIERIARQQYNLVKPGEQAYAILPGPGDEGAPGSSGATTEPAKKPGFWSRVADDLSFWN